MKAYLVLENGMVFEGRRIGAPKDSTGELVFTTGMEGYLETLTDPSYAGQIIMQTFPLIGNYGVISQDFEGESFAAGYVVRELCDAPSNFRSEGDLDSFLKEKGIPGICGVDTRQITRIIREQGVMNAAICSSVPEDLQPVKDYRVRGQVGRVSCRQILDYPASGMELFRVVLVDYGAKRNIIRCLTKRGCRVTVVPHNMVAEDILMLEPDGIMLSNGPGDPAENTLEINQIRKLIGKLPVFGICLGHQLTALAMGGSTYKLKYGHRGANQPVKRLSDGRTFISSQNHGYAVDIESMEGKGSVSFINANDGSCEGMEYPGKNCFTVQFHPEASAGPHDTEFLFDRFIKAMGGGNNA
ncbi:MAG: glutamine-hydrolyzing carbamoyl-phosphate synthase small subunit [Firmicutes bacterium]|nr:glutamine-hydrolyzing carbamoyl-phosphate synthase small subunit [Bacillota bacterium]